jgi:hypothetical protein
LKKKTKDKYMSGVLIIAGLCAIVGGLLQIFARDMAWKSAQWNNKLRGAKSERTTTWEVSSVFQGIMIIFGGIMMLWMAGQTGPKQPHKFETIETPAVPVRPR